jgi:glutamine synthetase
MLRFTDPREHVTFDIGMIEAETFSEGQMLDGSSIAGWKAIKESDRCLMPDPSSACIDSFFAENHAGGPRRARADHQGSP